MDINTDVFDTDKESSTVHPQQVPFKPRSSRNHIVMAYQNAMIGSPITSVVPATQKTDATDSVTTMVDTRVINNRPYVPKVSMSRNLRTQLPKKVGLGIKVLRLGKGLTQREFAILIGIALGKPVDQGYVSKIEASAKGVSLDRLGLILDVLDHDMTALTKAIELVTEAEQMEDKDKNQTLRDLTKKHLNE